MSIDAFQWAWIQQLPPDQKLLLLALADGSIPVTQAILTHGNNLKRLNVLTFDGESIFLVDGFDDSERIRLAAKVGVNLSQIDDLLNLLIRSGHILFRTPEISFPDESANEKLLPCFLYVMHSDDGFTKVGVSQDTVQRLAAINASFPRKVTLLGRWLLPDRKTAEEAEKLVLGHFEHYREVGEWIKHPLQNEVIAKAYATCKTMGGVTDGMMANTDNWSIPS